MRLESYNHSRDVLIVGGGVIGLGIARELHRRGLRRVTLIEQGRCGEESSWAAAGMLGPQVEVAERDRFFDVCSESRDLYSHFAAQLLEETGVDAELDRTGTLSLAFDDAEVEELQARFESQRECGLTVEFLSGEDVRRLEPAVSPDVKAGLFFAGDWQVDNRKLLMALRRYAEINGISVIENTRVERLSLDAGRVTGVQTANGVFDADLTIAATGAWTSLIKLGNAQIPVHVEPVRGQIVEFRAAERLFRYVIYSPRGYVVPRADGRILAGSTTEYTGFEKGVTQCAADDLTAAAREIVPDIAHLEMTDQWFGLRPMGADGMPVIGAVSGVDGLLIATAHYRNGILLAPLTAKIIADKITDGSEHVCLADFSPNRFPLAARSSN